MAETPGPYGRKTQRAPAVRDVHILWITAGLSPELTTGYQQSPRQPGK
jgi:hydrogenase small subunit